MQLTCEVCGATVTNDIAISIFLYYPMPGKNHPGQQCSVVQHFYCSHQCAMIGTLVCLFYHMDDDCTHDKTPPLNVYTSPVDLVALKAALAQFTE